MRRFYISLTIVFIVQDYVDYKEIKKPERMPSINSAPASSVPQPNPTTETPLKESVTEAMRPCKEESLSYSYDSYEYESSFVPEPCTQVTTTTESKDIEVNAVAPILTKKCKTNQIWSRYRHQCVNRFGLF